MDVRFTYTLDGILEVECKVDGQESAASLVIERALAALARKRSNSVWHSSTP